MTGSARFLGLLSLVLLIPLRLPAAPAPHVVVISIDAMRPEFYLPGGLSTNCPTLVALRDAGSHARAAISVYPSLTYPAHTTIATGVFPARHGIDANSVFSPSGEEGRGYWFASDLRVTSIWDRVHQAGLTVATVSWPCTAGAKTIDWNLPEFWTTPLGKAEDQVSKYATPGLLPAPPGPDELAWDQLVTDTAVAIVAQHQPNLLLVHFVETDKVQHRRGRDAPELPTALHHIDAHIAAIRAAVTKAGLEDQTTFIVLGDHGFSSIESTIAPNTLLAEAGLITVEHGQVKNWRAFVRHTGGSAGVYLKNPADTNTLQRVQELLTAHAKTAAGEELYRLVPKAELQQLGGPAGAAFYLEAKAPYMFSGIVERKTLLGHSMLRGNHGFLPTKPDMHTGFIIAGRGVKSGVALDTVRLVDVTPTVAELLGIKCDNVDGRAISAVLR